MSSFDKNDMKSEQVVDNAQPLGKPTEVLRVMVPQGSYPGSDLNVTTEDGRNFMIVIPDNCNPGDTFCIEIHNDAEGGAMVVVAEDQALANPNGSGSKAALGAASVGACIGFLVMGPLTAVAMGAGALYATTRGDKVGEVARSTGSTAVTAYGKVKDLAEKYHVREKVSSATKSTVDAAKQIDEDYKVVDSLKSATSGVIKSTREINEKYDISGKTKRATASLASSVMNQINKRNSEHDAS